VISGQPAVLRAEAGGQRLDQFLAEQLDQMSRSYAHGLILAGRVRVLGRVQRPSYRLQAGDEVRVEIPPPVSLDLIPEHVFIDVLYEDEDMLVVDKPAGMAVHPSAGHRQHTLVHALLARYPELPGIAGTQRPGIVHRLDKDTSGLMMVAKNDRGLQSLSQQLAARSVKKGYFALLKGALPMKRGAIEAPIARDPRNRQRMAIVAGGRAARTLYAELARLGGYAFVIAMPLTGRTHQIRVHFSSMGAPIAGDPTYGGKVDFLSRQFLHAGLLQFRRPANGEEIALESKLPADLVGALAAVGPADNRLDQWIERMIRLSKKHFRSEVN
jgi:23S rRNA pseudouridine1911/1915/1917 synthase